LSRQKQGFLFEFFFLFFANFSFNFFEAPREFASEHEATGEPFTVIYPRLQYKIDSAAGANAAASCSDDDEDSTMTILLIIILVLFILQSIFLCSMIYYEKTMRPLFMFGNIVSKE